LSAELEKAEYNKGQGTVVPNDGKYKSEKLAEAGISTSSTGGQRRETPASFF
jgi:hypothetical protein